MIALELCIDNFEAAKIAADKKFKRVELCANLAEGGTTPSIGLIQKCASLKSVEVHVIIRPRPGNFVYTQDELEVMSRDIVAASIAGAKGVVFGCLTNKDEFDLKANLMLCEIALHLKLEMTFHRAFDLIIDWQKALIDIEKSGFNRILTSGAKSNVNEGIPHLKELNKQKGNLQIMAGGGVNANNATLLINAGVDAIHFTARKIRPNHLDSGYGDNFEIDLSKIDSIISLMK